MSFVYLRDWEDSNGDAIEREVYCSAGCYHYSLTVRPVGAPDRDGLTLSEGGAWPGYESEHDEYCSGCEKVAAYGAYEEE